MHGPGEAHQRARSFAVEQLASIGSRSRPRLGLLGGTFDPPHAAHLHMARAALGANLVDEVVVIPAGDPWQKVPQTPVADRLAMTRLAFEGEPYCIVDDLETHREGPTFAIDTVFALHSPHLQLRFIIGSDTLALLPTWHRIEELVRLCDFLVVERPGSLLVAPDIEGLHVNLVPGEVFVDASTQIRADIMRTGRRPSELDPAVWRYIAERGLYGVRGG